MNNYEHPIMPKSTKVRLTVVFMPFVDLMIIFAAIGIGMQIAKIFNLNAAMQFVMMGFGGLVGILSVVRTPLDPKMPNWRVMLGVFRQDRHRYYPIVLTPELIKKEKSEEAEERGDDAL